MTVSRKMTLKDFRQYVKKLKSTLTGAESVVVKGIHSGVMRSLSIVHKSVDNAPPASDNGKIGAFDTGGYKLRWHWYLTRTGGGLRNSHPAADVIERGRRRNRKRPPLKVIKAWSRRRLGLSEAEAETAKYAIANAIAKRGLRGRKVLTNSTTHDKITKAVMDEVRAEVRAALRAAGRRTK